MLPHSIIFLRILEVLFSIISCTIHFMVIFKVLRATKLHPCQRLTLIIFELSSIVFSSTLSLDALIATFRERTDRFPKETKDWMDYTEATLLLISFSADYTVWLAQNFCILERTISTILLDSYDGRFRSTKEQMKLFLLFAIVNALQIGFSLINKYFLLILVVIHASLNSTMSLLLLRANRRADRIETSLGVRYQVKENLKVLKVFAPLAGLCVFWQIISCLLFVLPLVTQDESTIALFTALFLVTSELYPLSVSSTLLFSSAFGPSPCRINCWEKKVAKVEPESEGQIYRQILHSQWN